MNITELQNPPNLQTLLEKAKAQQVVQRPLAYYSTVISVLHKDKCMPAADIVQWLKDNDCGDYSRGSVYKLLRKMR